MRSIVLTGGGSAGHCIPNLALIPYLKKDFDKIYYIGSNGIEKSIIEKAGIPYYTVPCEKLRRSFSLKNLLIPFKVISGIKKSEKILSELKPDVVFSKGGYVALPVVIASKNRNIPVVSHESDLSIGLANKICSKYSKKVLTSFPETAKTVKNGQYIGPPIRETPVYENKKEILSSFNLTSEKPTILVLGGSLGSKKINEVLRKAIDTLLLKYQIIHICGKENYDKKSEKKGYVQIPFYYEMDKLFSVIDVCISRAGSNTLFELLYNKIPSVVIPLPKGASRGDQILNAEYFYKKGLIYMLKQDMLTEDSLAFAIDSVYCSRKNINQKIEKQKVTDKSREIVSVILKECK